MRFSKIIDKKELNYDGKVYDLCIENSHSYNIDGLVVHNSGAGSIVNYALEITKINPLQYDLLFERFLNPDRGHLPDIDSDFCVKKGSLVFKHLNEKYGKDNCCNILTFGRLQTKAVIKDIAKVMDIPYDQVNIFTKLLPSGPGADISIEEILNNPEYNQMPFVQKYHELFEHAVLLEGSPRHVSQHPAGIAITPKPVYEICPTYYGKPIELANGDEFLGNRSQFEKDQCELVGLVKLDILKLKNVTELDEEVDEINELYGTNMTLEDIPLDDVKTWQAFKDCNVIGVFQFSSPVSVPVLKKMQCGNMEELSAANSLIRPGTGGLDDYVKGKKDPRSIRVLDPRLDKHLKSTYGTIVFQEQIMGLISELLGISFGQADIYRRALEKMHKAANKKKVDYFNDNVTSIATGRGFKPDEIEFIRRMILDNCGYAFNKSHAVCYSYIAYYTCWMKINHQLIFHKTMLNGNLDKLSEYIDMAREDNIDLLLPSINKSQYKTVIESEVDKSLRIGFNTMSGVGEKAVEAIVRNRPYVTINDFFEQNDSKATNKKVVEALFSAGAFDGMAIKVDTSIVTEQYLESLGFDLREELVYLNRKQLVDWYQYYLEMGSVKTMPCYEIPITKIKNKFLDQYNMVPEKDNPNIIIIPEMILSTIGLTVDDGPKSRKRSKGQLKDLVDSQKIIADPYTKPFIKHSVEMSKIVINKLELYLEEVNKNDFSFLPHPLTRFSSKITTLKEAKDGDNCIEAGIITGMTERKTVNNKTYYWLILRSPKETIRVTLWDNQYKKYKKMINQYGLIAIKGVKGYGGMSCEQMKLVTPEK